MVKASGATGWGTWLCILLCLAPPEGGPQTDDRAVLVQEIRELAYLVPPEFGADALLQLVEMGWIGAPKEKRLLLEDTFRMAAAATFQQRRSFTGTFTDTRFDSLARAYDLGLDTESLRLRAVELLLPLDPSLAREWFETSLPRRIPPHDCRYPLRYDPRRWYRALGQIVEEGFTAREQEQGEHLRYAEAFLRRMSSPAEVIPAARWLASLVLAPDEFARLVRTFSEALARLPADDRAFDLGWERTGLSDVIEALRQGTDLPSSANLIEVLDKLLSRCVAAGVPCEGLAPSLRSYLARQHQGVRCADTIQRALRWARAPVAAMEPIASTFNRWKGRLPPYVPREVPPLSDNELAPAKVEAAAEDFAYWRQGEAKELLRDFSALRFGRNPPPPVAGRSVAKPLPVEARKTRAWIAQLHDFLKRLESWKPAEEESEIDHFHQNAGLYEGLLELVPPGIEREQVLQRYLDFLVRSRFQREKPVEWFAPVRELLHRLKYSKLTEAGAQQRQDRDVEWVLGELEQAGSPILTLYAKLERLKAVSAARSR